MSVSTEELLAAKLRQLELQQFAEKMAAVEFEKGARRSGARGVGDFGDSKVDDVVPRELQGLQECLKEAQQIQRAFLRQEKEAVLVGKASASGARRALVDSAQRGSQRLGRLVKIMNSKMPKGKLAAAAEGMKSDVMGYKAYMDSKVKVYAKTRALPGEALSPAEAALVVEGLYTEAVGVVTTVAPYKDLTRPDEDPHLLLAKSVLENLDRLRALMGVVLERTTVASFSTQNAQCERALALLEERKVEALALQKTLEMRFVENQVETALEDMDKRCTTLQGHIEKWGTGEEGAPTHAVAKTGWDAAEGRRVRILASLEGIYAKISCGEEHPKKAEWDERFTAIQARLQVQLQAIETRMIDVEVGGRMEALGNAFEEFNVHVSLMSETPYEGVYKFWMALQAARESCGDIDDWYGKVTSGIEHPKKEAWAASREGIFAFMDELSDLRVMVVNKKNPTKAMVPMEKSLLMDPAAIAENRKDLQRDLSLRFILKQKDPFGMGDVEGRVQPFLFKWACAVCEGLTIGGSDEEGGAQGVALTFPPTLDGLAQYEATVERMRAKPAKGLVGGFGSWAGSWLGSGMRLVWGAEDTTSATTEEDSKE